MHPGFDTREKQIRTAGDGAGNEKSFRHTDQERPSQAEDADQHGARGVCPVGQRSQRSSRYQSDQAGVFQCLKAFLKLHANYVFRPGLQAKRFYTQSSHAFVGSKLTNFSVCRSTAISAAQPQSQIRSVLPLLDGSSEYKTSLLTSLATFLVSRLQTRPRQCH